MEIDLNLSYSETSERITRDYINGVLPHIIRFKEAFESGIEVHGMMLTEDVFTIAINEHLTSHLKDRTLKKHENDPFYIKNLISTGISDFGENLQPHLESLLSQAKFDHVIYPDLPIRFRSKSVLVELLQVIDVGVDAFIDLMKDEFYIKFQSIDDYRFAQEVEELADHYNRITSKMRIQDRIMAERILFTKDIDGVLHPRKDNLLTYQSWYGDQIAAQSYTHEQ